MIVDNQCEHINDYPEWWGGLSDLNYMHSRQGNPIWSDEVLSTWMFQPSNVSTLPRSNALTLLGII